MQPDSQNPSRWRRVRLCTTADRGLGKLTFKESVIQVCNQRADKWAEEVRIRIGGAVTDHHAADARYHDDCRKKLMNERSVKSAAKASMCPTHDTDKAFDLLMREMTMDVSRVWTSLDLYDA